MVSGFLLSNIAVAQTSSTNFKTQAVLSGKCEISATAMNFGNIVGGQLSSTATADFNVKCTKSTNYQYYIGNDQWGVDCPYLLGASKGDRIVYGIKDLQTNNYTANNFTGTGGANGSLVSRVGTGFTETLSFQGMIQSPLRDGYGRTFDSCATTYQNPGIGYNPYVTPDSYSATMVFGIIY